MFACCTHVLQTITTTAAEAQLWAAAANSLRAPRWDCESRKKTHRHLRTAAAACEIMKKEEGIKERINKKNAKSK